MRIQHTTDHDPGDTVYYIHDRTDWTSRAPVKEYRVGRGRIRSVFLTVKLDGVESVAYYLPSLWEHPSHDTLHVVTESGNVFGNADDAFDRLKELQQ